MPNTWDPTSPPPAAALEQLLEGNRRFVDAGGFTAGPRWRKELAEQTQRPFAIVLGCSDSRMPVEILFDQGFGDLFVVRIAGNIVSPAVVGSIEFAASQFGTRLIVVLGHTRCGAIAATAQAIETGSGHESQNIRAITDRISPHIHELISTPRPDETRDERLHKAVRANVRASADHLRHGTRLLEDLVLGGRVAVVGAEYELESGKVHVFDGLPL